MKILIISTGISKNEDYCNGGIGGIEYQIFEISKKLTELGYDVTIVRKFWGLQQTETINGIKIINLQSKINFDLDLRLSLIFGIISRLNFSIKIRKLLKEIQPDFLVVNEILSSVFIPKIGIKQMYISHIPPKNFILNEYRSHLFHLIFLSIFGIIENFLLSRFDIVISLNNAIHQYFLKKGYKSILIPNSINYEDFDSGVDNNYILYGGRLVPEKGIFLLIDAYMKLEINFEKTKLIIIGSGPLERKLKKYVTSCNFEKNIEFIPWLNNNEFKIMMKNCSIFVLPSMYECMPVSLLEAMAYGKIVVASDIPGPQDIIKSGYNGFLFEKGNVNDLINIINYVLNNEKIKEYIGDNAKRTIMEEYNILKNVNLFIEIFNNNKSVHNL